ncbi:MAG: cysteine peptidase family C39 domain-containing protein [bacterium]
MKSKLSFRRQEKPSSCAVACLRMILSFYGIEEDEKTLRNRCGTTELGTYAQNIAACAQDFGFQASAASLDVARLKDLLRRGIFPIVYVNVFPLEQIFCTHAMVIEHITESEVLVLDPMDGRRLLSIKKFQKAWEMTGHLAIVIFKDITT